MLRDLPVQKLERPGARSASPRLIQLTDTPPYWSIVGVDYDSAWRDDETHYGDLIPDREWLVLYPADYLPDASDPVWVEFLSGEIAHEVAGSIFTITDLLGAAGYLYYEYDIAALETLEGAVVETRVQIDADDAAVNQGAVLSLFDGTFQYTVWLRADGLNLDGQADVPADLTTFRLVRLETQGGHCHLYLDGEHQQAATYMNPTAEKKIVFGTWVEF